MDNLFADAIDRKELQKFALGEDRYAVADRSGRPGHSVAGSWNQWIMELHDDDAVMCADGVRSMFASLVGNSASAAASRVRPLLDHLEQYWSQRHAGWLQFELGPVSRKIVAAVGAERERCRHESPAASATIEATIARIRRLGGLADLPQRT